MVGAEGFDPPTLCSQSRCATRLRYAPTARFYPSVAGCSASPAKTRLPSNSDDRKSSPYEGGTVRVGQGGCYPSLFSSLLPVRGVPGSRSSPSLFPSQVVQQLNAVATNCSQPNAIIEPYGGYSSVAERRSVAADVVGSTPTSRPNPPTSRSRRTSASRVRFGSLSFIASICR
jgi:hypothetical protein